MFSTRETLRWTSQAVNAAHPATWMCGGKLGCLPQSTTCSTHFFRFLFHATQKASSWTLYNRVSADSGAKRHLDYTVDLDSTIHSVPLFNSHLTSWLLGLVKLNSRDARNPKRARFNYLKQRSVMDACLNYLNLDLFHSIIGVMKIEERRKEK